MSTTYFGYILLVRNIFIYGLLNSCHNNLWLNMYHEACTSLCSLTDQISLDAGASKEFRVVQDNRANQNASKDLKHAQSSTTTNERVPSNLLKR